jgi:aryl-alcohol dehydrogenase-like predicted oxidoreductase
VEYRLLGASGLQVPVLSFGTGTFGGGTESFKAWGASGVKEATRLVDVCLEAGLNWFDTADVYSNGLAEEILGKAIAGRRDKLLISTKGTFRLGTGPNDVGSSRHHLLAACEASLRRIGTDSIDIYYIHGFDARTAMEETLRTMDDLVSAGKVRYVGCSNFSGWHLMKALATADRRGWPRYVAHQVYYSLVGREFEWELMPLALDQKVGTVVWSALAGGQLTGKITRTRPAPEGTRAAKLGNTRSSYDPEQFYNVVDALDAIGKETGRSVSQVALRWVLQRPTVSAVVIGARTEAQLRDNLKCVEFNLTPEQMQRLDDVSATRPVYPYWHQWRMFGERNPPPVPQPLA